MVIDSNDGHGLEDGTSPSSASWPVLAVGLVGLLALASRAGSVLAPSGGGGADRLAILVAVAALFGLGLPVAAGLALALRRLALVRDGSAPPRAAALLRAVPLTTFALAVASMLLISRGGLPRAEAAGGASIELPGSSWGRALSIVGWWDSPVKAGEGEPDPEGAEADGSDGSRALLLLVLFGAVGAAAVAVGFRATRRSRPFRRAPRPTHDGSRAAAHGAVVGAIDAMLSDPDPRTAIIGAYARLLEHLAASGTPRRPYEGPVEHLQRVLATLRVGPRPLRTLIDLFQVARFSTHRLTPAHRDRALEALRAVATDLSGAPPVRPLGPPTVGAAP